ncbi:hypothetical protein EVAR_2849_1 [Eumeta japonica]|uniref:Uncharacterized protein n=1 Tax=Eumeta variegata TaxID=151549 RepID=A0A4C1T3J6_EUMVA|nr:hypothetical protein EVAR_2849_1 [Eumeta japonica]
MCARNPTPATDRANAINRRNVRVTPARRPDASRAVYPLYATLHLPAVPPAWTSNLSSLISTDHSWRIAYPAQDFSFPSERKLRRKTLIMRTMHVGRAHATRGGVSNFLHNGEMNEKPFPALGESSRDNAPFRLPRSR